jgi:uncharacterized protein YlxW (UPF0749 family)
MTIGVAWFITFLFCGTLLGMLAAFKFGYSKGRLDAAQDSLKILDAWEESSKIYNTFISEQQETLKEYQRLVRDYQAHVEELSPRV